MAFNGYQRVAHTTDDNPDGMLTKQPSSDTEGSAYLTAEPSNEAVEPGRIAFAAAGQTSSTRARQRSDSVKKTRPRMSYVLPKKKKGGGVRGCMFLLRNKTAEGT